MRIITISRQFGSGGRELGKRLSDLLGWDYYDREIITALAEQSDMDEDAVRELLSTHGWQKIHLSYRHSLAPLVINSGVNVELLRRQTQIIRAIPEAGNDCIIVGRDADITLQEYAPLRIQVCADMEARLARCMRHEAKKDPSERLTEKELLRSIRRIDRERAATREILSGRRSEDAGCFDLTVNTSRLEARRLAAPVADFARSWFTAQLREREE
jgi:cytidylate kinase